MISITGNGYKTLEAVTERVEQSFVISARLQEFDELYNQIVSVSPERAAGA